MKSNTIEYNDLVREIAVLVKKKKGQLYHTINHTITSTYWNIGKYLVEFEQRGNIRAQYGTELLKNLSKDLTRQFGRGYSYRNLQLAKKLYNTFPIMQSLIAQFPRKEQLKPSEKALLQCSWTHLVRLLSISNETERNFYLIETVENNWSVRELNRQIDTALFERLAISTDKKNTNQLGEEGQVVLSGNNIVKDPYVLEFLGIKESPNYSESDLEAAIIENLEHFLLELGKGFSFVSRQKRISSDSDHFYIDLVFYNRLLKCHVLIDLKIGKLKHQDIGQMQMYVNYFDREIKTDFENPTIGIILCKEKNDFVVEYSLPKDNKQIYPKEYQLYLPDKKELKKLLKKYI